ncbi:sugar ABC transporter ATP-binding protein [Geodermatophilus sp. SYSU D00815]
MEAALTSDRRDEPAEAAPAPELALEMRGITKTFGAVPVLRGVDYLVRRGSIHALVGHNGAGKSTLMKIALGGHAPTEGLVRIAGNDLTVARPSEARRLGLGMVLQERSLIPTLNGLDNIFLNAEHIGRARIVKRRSELAEATSLCDRLGISHDVLGRRVADMTAVEQQMVEIAKAVRLATNVLVLDEPTAPLSHREIDALFDVIRRVASLGAGIVLITHHLAEVFAVSDEVTCLREGRVTLHTATDRTDIPSLIEAMIGRSRSTIEAEPEARGPVDRDAVPVLSVQDLSVTGKFPGGISFDVAPGEIVGVAGLVGSGRSTLLKALFGAVPVAGGRVELKGRPYAPRTPWAAIDRRVFLIPENRADEGLVPSEPIVENVILPVLRDVTSARVVRMGRARSLTRSFMSDLNVRASGPDQLVGELSGGNQQKVVLAKALATRADLLLLDEPTFGVDVGAAAELIRHVRAMAAQGKGVLWATSDLQELLAVADRVLVVADGTIREVIARGDPGFSEAHFIEAMQRRRTPAREDAR